MLAKLTEFQILECFVASMMTIYDEYKDHKKYFYLNFVEFQEMICRIALITYDEQETVDHKVFNLL